MKTNASTSLWYLDSLTDAERFGLELRWYEGRMLLYVEWLISFVVEHREEIVSAVLVNDTAALLAATKQLVAQRGSIHLAAELKDQRQEIENELWYRGEKGESCRRGISLDWTARHAAAWRRWRVQEYLFVADRCAGEVAMLLRAPARDDAESASG